MTQVIPLPGPRILEANKLGLKQIDEWNRFVESHPYGEIYHTSYWQNVIAKSFHYDPFYVVKQDSRERIVAGIPVFQIKSPLTRNRLCVLPGAQSCDPLVDNQQDYDQIIGKLKDFGDQHRFNYLELRTSKNFGLDTGKFGGKLTGYCTYILDIDKDIEEIRGCCHKNCIQRPLKKAFQNDLELRIGQSQQEMRQFYELYLIMRKDNGLLPQPYRFFKSLCDELGKKGLLDIYLCLRGGKVISAILLLKYKDKATYEYGATLPDAYKYNPSHFLLWNAIVNAQKDGYKKFDFGRTGDDNDTLGTFKSRWGAEKVDLLYYFIPEIETTAEMRQKSSLKKIMDYTVRNSPIFFSRFVGNILYRYLI